MCGRYSLTADQYLVAEEFQLGVPKTLKWKPRFNIAPSQAVPVLIKQQSLEMEYFRWGLVPSWAKDPAIGHQMINARQETVAEKPSFRGPFKNSRCLIPADGFYEWKAEGKTKKPHYIRLKSKRPFSFAGLCSQWAGSDGSEILSCAIITCEANELLKPIHARMPVLIEAAGRDAWLEPANHDARTLNGLLRPYPASEMEAYEVTTFVNSPANDAAECLSGIADS
ncbi:MAG: SOS response-associated peptidase [Candidatus Omnitrophota bacterium]|nr:SOS response-associated peptidase [Candidatus Omnitrophota bacterium]